MRFLSISKVAIIIISLFLTQEFAFAQKNLGVSKGYIVKSGERHEGEIQAGVMKKLQQTCFFRPTSSESFIAYKPGEIESFYVEGEGTFKSFRNVVVAGKPPTDFFIHLLTDGNVKLFDLVDDQNRFTFLIERNDELKELEKKVVMDRSESGTIVKKTIENYKKTLTDAFTKCPQDVSKVQLYESSLLKVLVKYNTCVDSSFSYVRQRKSIFFSVGYSYGFVNNSFFVDGGIGVTELRSDGYYLAKRDISENYNFKSVSQGVSFEMRVGSNKHFSIMGEALISKTDFDTDIISLKYSTFDLPFSLKYSMGIRSPIRPHVSVGLLFPVLIDDISSFKKIPVTFYRVANRDGTSLSYPIPAELSSATFRTDLEFNRIRLMYSCGLDWFVSNRFKLTGLFRLSFTDISRNDYVSVSNNSSTLYLGAVYNFK